jgi:hypothetical protein
LGTFALADLTAFLPVDVNGDGVMDLLQVWTTPGPQGTTLHLTTFLCNAAGGFTLGPDTTFENRTLGDFYPMGINGGGQAALVNKWVSGAQELMFSGFSVVAVGRLSGREHLQSGRAVSGAQFVPGDVNWRRSNADLLRVTMNQNQQPVLVPYTSSGPLPGSCQHDYQSAWRHGPDQLPAAIESGRLHCGFLVQHFQPYRPVVIPIL